MELSNMQVEYIQKHLKFRGIRSDNLEVDILDHVCCLIEQKMDNGWSFKKSLLYALRKFGPNGLRKIQDETTISTSKAFILLRLMNIGLNTFALFLALGFILGPVEFYKETGLFFTTLSMAPFFILGILIINSFNFRKYEFAR